MESEYKDKTLKAKIKKHAEKKAVISRAFRNAVKRNNVILKNYETLKNEMGMDAMKRPEGLKYY